MATDAIQGVTDATVFSALDLPRYDPLNPAGDPIASADESQSGQLRTDFLELLVTQLQNQNPLEPLDNNEMASQLSQLAQLEQLENISSNFARMQAGAQVAQAAGLLGKQIAYDAGDGGKPRVGAVDSVIFDDGEAWLIVGKDAVGFKDILSVQD